MKGADVQTLGRIYVEVVQAVLLYGVRYVGDDNAHWEASGRIPPQGGPTG